jgi:hypothetical protein
MLCAKDEQGQYHGAKVVEAPEYNQNKPIKRGNSFYYDGHVDLRRDPAPSPTDEDRVIDWTDLPAYVRALCELIYAQRGLRPPNT